MNGSPTSLIVVHLPKSVRANLTYLPQKTTIHLEGKKNRKKKPMLEFDYLETMSLLRLTFLICKGGMKILNGNNKSKQELVFVEG